MSPQTDRIQKQILLQAPCDRVWRAISDSKQFGTWFGVDFDGPFVAGTRLSGRMTPTKMDPDIAKAQEPYAGMVFDIIVERIEPMRLFSFKWHPGASGPASDNEPMTLVEFELEEVQGGTMLTITESGFDRIPLERRAEAFSSNEQGWTVQAKLIEKYLTQASEA